MQPLRGLFKAEDFPSLLVGLDEPDDAAIYQISPDLAIISTVDFFPPVVDEPYAFGAIAAANALSDIYAMGGKPLMAINLVAYPDGLGLAYLTEILRGGAEKVMEAGAVIAGGHTVTDREPKYGLAVTGTIRPDEIMTKAGARIGDQLVLTKPLGTGTITTALKNGRAEDIHIQAAVSAMMRLNRSASRLARQYAAHAMTDITGYSLLGHAHEMAHLGHVAFEFWLDSISWLPGAETYAKQDIFPGGMWRNREYFEQWVTFGEDVDEFERMLLFDPQTSGGLLLAVAADRVEPLLADLTAAGDEAHVIGHVIPGDGTLRVVRDRVIHPLAP